MPQIHINCPDSIHVKRTGKKDTKRKFYINTDTNKGICFRCKFTTRRAKEVCEENNIHIEFTRNYTVDDSPPAARLALPTGYKKIFTGVEGQKALQYLLKRGISRQTIASYEIGYCGPYADPKYANRVLIPFYSGGRLVNFQARALIKGVEPRYTGPSKADGAESNCLFNLDRAAENGVIFLVEGPFDALRLPEYAVSLVGSVWNETKRKKILQAKPLAVILCLDNDQAGKEATSKIYKDLFGLVEQIHFFELGLPYKDLGELPPDRVEAAYQFCRQTASLSKHAARGN